MDEIHTPVLLKEVLEVLNPEQGGIYFDGTINGGGHAGALLNRVGGSGKVIGFDWDCDLIHRLRIRYPKEQFKNLELECANYADAKEIFLKKGWGSVNGILLDLGFSSYHIEQSGQGFSFRRDEPLDMRYHREGGGVRAYDIVNFWSEEDLYRIIREYGEDRFSAEIAFGVVRARAKNKIATSRTLADIVVKSIPRARSHGKIHPATRTFQALRIAVNHEFENLQKLLDTAPEVLKKGGRIAIISFHSLEDRIVKIFFNMKEKEGVFSIPTKKVIRAAREESRSNPRARSARLRIAIKL